MPREEFNREVDRFLTGRESEPWELLYFKIYKSQLGVIERALETAGLMLGTDKSRGYCLEMICADFVPGANIEEANPEALVLSLWRQLLPRERPSQFLFEITSKSCLDQRENGLGFGWSPKHTKLFAGRFLPETIGAARIAAHPKTYKFIIAGREASLGTIASKT